jgi:hypothetical protein
MNKPTTAQLNRWVGGDSTSKGFQVKNLSLEDLQILVCYQDDLLTRCVGLLENGTFHDPSEAEDLLVDMGK